MFPRSSVPHVPAQISDKVLPCLTHQGRASRGTGDVKAHDVRSFTLGSPPTPPTQPRDGVAAAARDQAPRHPQAPSSQSASARLSVYSLCHRTSLPRFKSNVVTCNGLALQP